MVREEPIGGRVAALRERLAKLKEAAEKKEQEEKERIRKEEDERRRSEEEKEERKRLEKKKQEGKLLAAKQKKMPEAQAQSTGASTSDNVESTDSKEIHHEIAVVQDSLAQNFEENGVDDEEEDDVHPTCA